MVEVLGAGVSLHKLMLILGQVIVNRLDGTALGVRDVRFAVFAQPPGCEEGASIGVGG